MGSISKHRLHYILFSALLSLTTTLTSFGQSKTIHQAPDLIMQNGDLLFVDASTVNLSGAIDRVTQTSAKTAFDHVAMIEISRDSIFILHANPKTGTVRESLSEFLANKTDDNQHFAIYRLKIPYRYAIGNALLQAKKWLGRPYNFTYILNDDSLYCSDFVERIFRDDQIFMLEPMTFIDPTTQQTDTFWKSYYHKMNLEVPEGLPGCNPNGLAASDKLEYIGQWQ